MFLGKQVFGDLYVLECEENMDEGKTFDYWSHVYKDNPGYKYYLKVGVSLPWPGGRTFPAGSATSPCHASRR